MSTLNDGGWQTPEVAQAQLELTNTQLQEPERVGPFLAFKWIMARLDPVPGSLLDVGCGVGHYGRVCQQWFPDLHYYGSDISEPMIERAKVNVPRGQFRVCRFEDNWFDAYPLILVGQVMEYVTDPWIALDQVLREAHEYVILHRMRLTPDVSHRLLEPTYAGHKGNNYLWNRDHLVDYIRKRATIVSSQEWSFNLTMLVKK